MQTPENSSDSHETEELNRLRNLHAPWLGALFEIGGNVDFSTTKASPQKKLAPRAWPVFRFSNDNQEQRARFRRIFKSVLPNFNSEQESIASHIIRIQHLNATQLANIMQAFAPSRSLIIEYFKWWAEVSEKERYEVSVAYEHVKKSQARGSLERYASLVQSPRFVAGLLDMKDTFFDYSFSDPRKNNPAQTKRRTGLRLRSTNQALLLALHFKFGGSRPALKDNGFTWTIQSTDFLSMMEKVEPYLQVVKPPQNT